MSYSAQFLRPAVEPYGVEHPHGFRHRKGSKCQPRHHGARGGIFLAHFDIFVPPSLWQALVQEYGLTFLNCVPVVASDGEQKRTENPKLAKPVCYFAQAIQTS